MRILSLWRIREVSGPYDLEIASGQTSEKNKRKKQAKKTGEIAEWLDLSEARTRALLKEMADEGSIGSRGKTKKKEYYLLKKDI